MSEATKNKIAAQIIKAEIIGDQDRVEKLKLELKSLSKPGGSKYAESRQEFKTDDYRPRARSIWDTINEPARGSSKNSSFTQDHRVKRFLSATGSLSQMFEQEKKVTASDEIKMYMKTASKFSRDDMETKHFSKEIDDSQIILNKGKKRKYGPEAPPVQPKPSSATTEHRECFRCLIRLPKHLIIDRSSLVYVSLMDAKPFLSSMSNVILSNIDHASCDSFVSADKVLQSDVEKLIESLKDMWSSRGYRCIIMETYLRNRRPARNGLTSCGEHFQVHCLPIKEKHYERSRMSFKQALQNCEQEWSINKKLIVTDGRRIQRYLPKGLSYFWVCFDELTNGFGHVIEHENDFSTYFGLEVLSGLLDKDFNPMRLNQREEYRDQFERSRDFKLLYSKFRQTT